MHPADFLQLAVDLILLTTLAPIIGHWLHPELNRIAGSHG